MRHYFAFVILISLATFSVVSHAKIGTEREVIEAVKAKVEPAYLPVLLQALSTKLNQFVDARGGLKSPHAKASFLVTMRIYNDIAAVSAGSGFKVAKSFSALLQKDSGVTYLALGEAADACSRLIWDSVPFYCCTQDCSNNWNFIRENHPPWISIRKVARQAALTAARSSLFKQISIAAFEGRKVTASEGQRMAYRVAEWEGLNHLLKRTDEILPAIYGVVEKHLPKTSKEVKTFESADAWSVFQSEKFGRLSPQAMVFLNPWLEIISRNL